jgi:hypothetical protein
MLKTNKMKKVLCTVDASKFFSGIETANIKVTSPSGKTLTAYKKHMSIMTNEELQLYNILSLASQEKEPKQMELTTEEMVRFLEMSKIPFFAISRDKNAEIKVGDFVTYIPTGAKGRVKAISEEKEKLFVVFDCNRDWDNYENYTGQSTDITLLAKR